MPDQAFSAEKRKAGKQGVMMAETFHACEEDNFAAMQCSMKPLNWVLL